MLIGLDFGVDFVDWKKLVFQGEEAFYKNIGFNAYP